MNAKDLKRRKKTPTGRTTASNTSRAYRDRVVAGIICILLAAIVWIVFGQTLGHDFVNYDDNEYVYDNPKITNGLTFSGVQWAFTHVHSGNWHPLTTVSHMLDCQLYGLEPWGHHLTNVLLHATVAILLFLALLRLTSAPAAQHSTLNSQLQTAVYDRRYNLWACAFVAALFAVHPLRVESVAWISERKDVLSGVFFALTLLAYARYARSERSSFGKYLTVVVFFALGLLCKPTMVTLPFVLLLLDYWPLRRMQRAEGKEPRLSAFQPFSVSVFQNVGGLVVEKIPLFILSVASCAATVVAQEKAMHQSLNLTLIERAENAVASYAIYLGQMFYPTHLAILYPYSKGSSNISGVVFDLGLLLAVSLICFFWRKKYPFLIVGWLWYLGMLLPMIGLIEVGVQTRADRYTYLPQIGSYIALAWGATELFRKWRLRPEIPAVAATIIVIALTACSYHEASFWQNSETLWKHALDNGADSYVAHYSLGYVFLQKRQPDAAIAEFQKALQTNSGYAASAEMDIGVALLQKGDLDGAISHTERAVQIDPNYFEAQFNLGNLFFQRGQPDNAVPHFQKAIAAKPDYFEAHNSLGAALAQKGELDQAITEFNEALRLRPDYAEAHTDLGNALASQRKFDQALPHYMEALRLNPNSPQAHCNLGYALLQVGRREEAVAHFTEALRLNPDYTEAKQRLRNLDVPLPQ